MVHHLKCSRDICYLSEGRYVTTVAEPVPIALLIAKVCECFCPRFVDELLRGPHDVDGFRPA